MQADSEEYVPPLMRTMLETLNSASTAEIYRSPNINRGRFNRALRFLVVSRLQSALRLPNCLYTIDLLRTSR